MPPLTDEFVESLKQDLQEQPIEPERSCRADLDGNKSSQENHWRNWQHIFDKHCMNWDAPADLMICFESAIRSCEKAFSENPIAVKGTPRQQMELMLVIWYLRPDLLLRQYQLVYRFVEVALAHGRADEQVNLINDNREQILAIFYYADCDHLKSGEKKLRQQIINEAKKEYSPEFIIMAGKWWWHVTDTLIVESLAGRVVKFIGTCAFNSVTEVPAEAIPESKTGDEAFVEEMSRQNIGETIRYVKALRKIVEVIISQDKSALKKEDDRLCDTYKLVDKFLRRVDLANTSSSEQMVLEGYRVNFPSLKSIATESAGSKHSKSLAQKSHTAKRNIFEYCLPEKDSHLDPGYRNLSYKGVALEPSITMSAVINVLHRPWLPGQERAQKRINKSAIVSRIKRDWEVEVEPADFSKVFRGKTGEQILSVGLVGNDGKGNWWLNLDGFETVDL